MIGLGTDILDIRRIEKTILKFNKKFKKRIFRNSEIEKCEKRKLSTECFAKRFAAKEAAAKALGTGFSKGVYWKDLEVVNLPSGKPTINFHGNSKKHLYSLIPEGSIPIINLSITDEFPYTQAIVTINADRK